MIAYPNINPIIASFSILGQQLEIRWYGVLYIVSFVLAYILLKKNMLYRNIKLDGDKYETFLFDLMLGVIVGGRLGYVLFYNFAYYIENPLRVFSVWEGGMSFHGGAIGVIIAGILFCRHYGYRFYQIADPAMPLVAVGLGLGRLGNFINGELYGRPTDVPWAMIFPHSDGLPRHPSQLYELALEGILLTIILQFIYRTVKKEGLVFWAFILLYGVFRFLVEFVRQPDDLAFYKDGYFLGFMTMGQILSGVMILVGGYGYYRCLMKGQSTT